MISKSLGISASPTRRACVASIVLILALLAACTAPSPEAEVASAVEGGGFLTATAYEVPHDVDLPAGATADQTMTDLATFAWKEFIALNWPSSYTPSTPTRGQPDTSKTPLDFTQPGNQTLVWQSYLHRVEIFPAGVFQSGGFFTYPNYPPSYNTPPQYFYRGVENGRIPACGPYDPSTGTWSIDSGQPDLQDLRLFNNLDETTQINLATMFVSADPSSPGAPPPAAAPLYMNLPGQPRRFIYQAKANQVMFDYISQNKLYQASTRGEWAGRTYTAVREDGLGGIAPCPAPPPAGPIICFPPGVAAGSEGSIEIKATWRQLTLAEANSGRYLTEEIIRYRNPDPGDAESFCYQTVPAQPTPTSLPYGLVGLHIIHKTTNVPTYVFATFEQIDNLDQSKHDNQLFYYNRNAGIVNPDRQVVTQRAHPISDPVEQINQQVHLQIRQAIEGSFPDSVWLYYKLIGVQGPASDFQADIDFFLANIVTETNEVLRSFSGTLDNQNGTIDPTVLDLFKGDKSIIAGGCKGCHGNAQVGASEAANQRDPGQNKKEGADFSFITANAPFDGKPDAINQPLLKVQPQWYKGIAQKKSDTKPTPTNGN